MDAASAVTSGVNSREVTKGIASGAARGSDVEKEENLSAIIRRTGFFHCTIFAYETIATLCLALHNLVHDASASDEDYWCRLPDPPANRTLEEWRDVNMPRHVTTAETGWHIKEDLATLVDMKNTGELTDEEITFYFFRMHDFDDNTMLDGIELLSAMQHTIDHGFAPPDLGQQSLDDMINLVDGALMLDTNNDGFVSYPELRVTLKHK
ncbi:hypothetical protein HPB49_025869 [Dermacentor silvarum]|nr:hypothetical protein HPB49_025869 [Dermacentor silvarum]